MSPRRAEGAILKTGYLILASLIFLSACAGDGGAAGEGSPDRAGSAVDTTAAVGKRGTYLARGSFTGGEVTDGRDVHDIEWSAHEGFERIEIRIHEAKWGDSQNASPVAVPCRFSVTREDFPARLLVVVSGTRMFSAQSPDMPAAELVTGFYRIVYLDDAGAMFAFDVSPGTEFEVFEKRDPAVIVIDIRKAPAGTRGRSGKVFSLRSSSWPHGERLGHFQEELIGAGASGSRIIRDAEGKYLVEEGLYPAQNEAAQRQRLLAGKGWVLYIEQRGEGDTPRYIEPEQH